MMKVIDFLFIYLFYSKGWKAAVFPLEMEKTGKVSDLETSSMSVPVFVEAHFPMHVPHLAAS